MKRLLFVCFAILLACNGKEAQVVKNDLRAPAYPLVTIDPYTSAWSFTDNLYDDNVKHWTGKDYPLLGVIRVDGKPYRFMGVEKTLFEPLAAISYESPWTGKYTFDEPTEDWKQIDFNDSKWKSGEAAFGTPEETNVKTLWETKDIRVRRNIKIDSYNPAKKLFLRYSHDDTFELYINGIQVVKTGYEWHKYVLVELSDEVKSTIKDGQIVIAAHCNNRTAGALVDFGIYTEAAVQKYFENAAVQKYADVQATQTHYVFECGNIKLKLSFLAPLLLDNLNLVSRPVNYITYSVESLDGNEHQTEIYFEASPEWALNEPSQMNMAEGYEKENLMFVRTGNVKQKVLGRSGDDVRIDWGYFYLCSEKDDVSSYAAGDVISVRKEFSGNGSLSGDVKSKGNAVIAIAQSLGKAKAASGKILIGYDDIYSITYFGTNLRPYWNKDGSKTIESAFAEANKEFVALKNKCSQFDYDLIAKATEIGGKKYAELCALAYRQSIAAHKLVEAPNGDLLFLSKENFSNGSIGTVDVTYPSSPLFLLYNPELAKGLLNHIFYYSESGKWTKPFPAHDIGSYPLANGQTYGGDMPIEEAGNMLILTAAIARVEGNAKYAEKHWDMLSVWTDYLIEKGLDPENQLCTDDFAGHLAHNVNLSVKAILGIASYSYLAGLLGKKEIAGRYLDKAREMAQQWETMADDGDHYRLTFDKPGTWSQKYNLIWDKLLEFNIFPDKITQKEIAWYLTKQDPYGLPLDSRERYTKADWIIWTAALSSDKATFERFIAPLHTFMNETVDRVPMSDWVNTNIPTYRSHRARSVVGGYFIKLLEKKLSH
jgi:formylmethanofuran dehydrogenase subunit D